MTLSTKKRATLAAGVAATLAPVAPAMLASPASATPGANCTTSDGTLIYTAPVTAPGWEGSFGTVSLWYSPSSRCTWAGFGVAAGVPNCNPVTFEACGQAVIQSSSGNAEYCNIGANNRKCVTAPIDDANLTAYAAAVLWISVPGEYAYGQTPSY